MILENIKNAYDYSSINPNFKKALEFLKNTDLEKLEPGRHEVDGTNVFANVQDYETFPKEERRWEAHKKYIDIQCVISGTEIMYCEPVERLEVVEDNFDEKDVAFYKDIDNASELVLKNGNFAILFPKDAHKPCCALNNVPSKVKKVVVKVAV